MNFTHDRNMLKQVKEEKGKLEWRDFLEQSNLKPFTILFVVVVKLIYLISIYGGKSSN